MSEMAASKVALLTNLDKPPFWRVFVCVYFPDSRLKDIEKGNNVF